MKHRRTSGGKPPKCTVLSAVIVDGLLLCTLEKHCTVTVDFLSGCWQCGWAGFVQSQAVLGQSQAVYLVTALTTLWIAVIPPPPLKGA